MSIVVTKSPSLVVRPSEPSTPMTGNIMVLSSFDRAYAIASRPEEALLAFEHPIHEPAETIKAALSRALVHYYPIAGRFAAGADGDVHVDCNGEGVAFVAASANCALKDVRFFDQSPELRKELVISYPDDGCRRTDPLLQMQVTVFSCCGFVVGVTWNHGIADGTGMAQFMQAVGELARGLSAPSVVPVRCDIDAFPAVRPFSDTAQRILGAIPPSKLEVLNLSVPWRLINRIRARAKKHGEPCTVFEAVTAVLWRCRTRAVMSDPEAPAVLVFAIDARKYVGTKHGYYGNCVTAQMVVTTNGAVANGDVIDVVRKIRRGVDEIPDQFKKNGGAYLHQAVRELGDQDVGYENLFMVTHVRNLGFKEVDFGSGKMTMLMTNPHQLAGQPFCYSCLPCKGEQDAHVASACVKAEHADALLGEIARLNSTPTAIENISKL